MALLKLQVAPRFSTPLNGDICKMDRCVRLSHPDDYLQCIQWIRKLKMKKSRRSSLIRWPTVQRQQHFWQFDQCTNWHLTKKLLTHMELRLDWDEGLPQSLYLSWIEYISKFDSVRRFLILGLLSSQFSDAGSCVFWCQPGRWCYQNTLLMFQVKGVFM